MAADELLELIRSGEIDLKAAKGNVALLDEQVRFILEVFLIASQELDERGLDTSSAALLTALAAAEVAFGKTSGPGASPNTPRGNIFSVQPLPALAKQLTEQLGVAVVTEGRGNRTSPDAPVRTTKTPTPQFTAAAGGDRQGGIRLAIKAELDLVAGIDLSKVPEAERAKVGAEGLKRIGPALQKGNLSVDAFGEAVRFSGQAGSANTPESRKFPGVIASTFGTTRGVLTRFERVVSAQDGVSAEAKDLLHRAVGALPRKGDGG